MSVRDWTTRIFSDRVQVSKTKGQIIVTDNSNLCDHRLNDLIHDLTLQLSALYESIVPNSEIIDILIEELNVSHDLLSDPVMVIALKENAIPAILAEIIHSERKLNLRDEAIRLLEMWTQKYDPMDPLEFSQSVDIDTFESYYQTRSFLDNQIHTPRI